MPDMAELAGLMGGMGGGGGQGGNPLASLLSNPAIMQMWVRDAARVNVLGAYGH
jgi:hypothetical protein